MSILNEGTWTPAQLETLRELENMIRRAADHIQIWEPDGGFPGLVPIDGLSAGGVSWDSIDGKPSTFPPDPHTHSWSEITDKPSTFPPSDHTHTVDDITDLAGASSIYSGYVPNTGVGSDLPSGWSAVRNSTGIYTITHNLGLSSASDLRVALGVIGGVFGQVNIQIQTISANNFVVEIVAADALANKDWFFIASEV